MFTCLRKENHVKISSPWILVLGIKILHIQEVYDTLSLSEAMRETDFDGSLMLRSGLRSCLENGGCSVGRSDKKTLYHYTDFQAVDGILRCAQLRVNNNVNKLSKQ